MEKMELRSGLIDNDTENIKITIESDIIDKKKMILKAIELILSSTNEEDEDLEFFEDALLTLVDHVGYKFYYWNQVEKNEKYYNEHEELIVSKRAKMDYLQNVLLKQLS